MSLEVVTLLVLLVVFVVGTVRSVNLGVLGFVAAFAVGGVGLGLDLDGVAEGFPFDLFIALVGITYLAGFARQNGTIDLLLRWGLRAVQGRVAAAPWIFFGFTGVLMAVGAIFAIAVVAPLAVPFARRYRIDQLMMGMMVVHGGMAGAFSPMSVYGVFVGGFLQRVGVADGRLTLFLVSFVINVVMGVVVFLALGGRSLLGRRVDVAGERADGDADAPEAMRPNGYQVLTIACLLAMALGTVAFGLDIGVVSMSAAVVLAIVNPEHSRVSLTEVSWSTVVLVCGMVTYIEILEKAGTVTFVSSGIAALGVPLLAVLLLCYLSGIVSALASSIATIGVATSIAAPFLASSGLSTVGVVAALAVSATIVDVSPFSTNGAVVLANVDPTQREHFYRRMLVYSGLVVALAPAAAWTAVFLPA